MGAQDLYVLYTPCYMYLICGTYDQIVNVSALHGLHKSQLQ